jgi:glycine hydroxymethyltransferase
MVLVSLIERNFSGEEASVALENAGITVNKNSIPSDPRPASSTSGIRLGSAALTTLGMKEKEFTLIAHRICDVLDDIQNIPLQMQIKAELETLLKGFRVYNYATY